MCTKERGIVTENLRLLTGSAHTVSQKIKKTRKIDFSLGAPYDPTLRLKKEKGVSNEGDSARKRRQFGVCWGHS